MNNNSRFKVLFGICLIVAVSAVFTLCKERTISLNAEELKTKYGIVLPYLQYDGDEIATSNGKGGPKQKASTVIVSVVTDLILNQAGDSVVMTVSSNCNVAAIQKFVSTTTNDGAISFQESIKRYTSPPASGTTTSAGTTGTGFYRGWCGDFDYTIHLSNIVTIP